MKEHDISRFGFGIITMNGESTNQGKKNLFLKIKIKIKIIITQCGVLRLGL
jgi:hypothetical protein